MSANSSYTTTIASHNGIHHADEVLASATIKLAFSHLEIEIVRSRNPKDWEKADFVLDVGGVFDPTCDRFDHHQGDFTRTYLDSDVKMATAGIVWEKYATMTIKNVTNGEPNYFETQKIDEEVLRNLIMLVDAHDNAQDEQEIGIRNSEETLLNCSFSTVISGFNERENGFEEAVQLAEIVLKNTILFAWKRIRGEKLVKEAYAQVTYISNDRGQGIMVLDEFTPWQKILSDLDPVEGVGFCVYPDVTGQWRCQTVKSKNGEDIRSLPKSWGALRAEELQATTGVVDAVFCHKNLFIAGAETKEGAIKLAKLAALS